MNYKEIVHIWFSDAWQLNFSISSWFFVLVGLLIIIYLYKFFKNYYVYEVELNIPLSSGKIKLKTDHETVQIAHKAWTELITRKAGLPFDPEHDVISEVYDSWYELFKTTRSLIKEIPAGQIKNKNTKLLVKTLVDMLNNGMRPHLTRWQARFNRWYKHEIENEKTDRAPQDIQKQYPHYKELTQELISVNKQLVSYANELKKLFD